MLKLFSLTDSTLYTPVVSSVRSIMIFLTALMQPNVYKVLNQLECAFQFCVLICLMIGHTYLLGNASGAVMQASTVAIFSLVSLMILVVGIVVARQCRLSCCICFITFFDRKPEDCAQMRQKRPFERRQRHSSVHEVQWEATELSDMHERSLPPLPQNFPNVSNRTSSFDVTGADDDTCSNLPTPPTPD